MSDILHIVLAADDNYIEFTTVAVTSLLHTNKDFSYIHIHLLDNGLSPKSVAAFRAAVPQERGQVHLYPTGNLGERLQTSVSDTMAITVYARLFIGTLLPADIEKVLYVDSDLVFDGSVYELYNTDLGGNLAGCVLDTCMEEEMKTKIGLKPDDPYINTGVMLIPLKTWREENIERRFIEFLLSRKGRVYLHDQGIINAVCAGRITFLPARYNVSAYFFSHPYTLLRRYSIPFVQSDDFSLAVDSPVVIHYTAGMYGRPWNENCTHPRQDIFLRYKAMTAYAHTPLRPDPRPRGERFLNFVFFHSPYWVYRSCKATGKLIKKARKKALKVCRASKGRCAHA